MHKIDSTGATQSMPTPDPVGQTVGFFAHGDSTTPYTVVTADWCNAVQMEIVNVIQASGILLDKTRQDQLLAALNAMFAKSGEMGGYVTTADLAPYAKKAEVQAGYQPILGYPPLQQGGGTGQGNNKIYIGWSGNGLKVQVDATDLGAVAFVNQPNVFTVGQTINTDLVVGRDVSVQRNLGVAGAIASNSGNVTAYNGRLRATYGAIDAGSDAYTATLLKDFPFSTAGYLQFPNACILQFGRFVSISGNGDTYNFPIAWPNGCFTITGSDDGAGLADVGLTAISKTQARMWCGYHNAYGQAPTYLGGVGITWIAVGY